MSLYTCRSPGILAGRASLSPHMPHPLERLACETSPLAAHPILLKYTIGAVDIQIIGPKTPYRGKSQFSFSGSVLYPVIACTVHDVLASFPGHRLGPGSEANDTHTHTHTHMYTCTHASLGIVESIPQNLTYPPGSPTHLSTYDAWSRLLTAATETVDIASFYWSLRGESNVSDPTDWEVGFVEHVDGPLS